MGGGKHMITDQRAESAVMYIRNKASEYAKAKAERIQIEEFRKTLKARLMQKAQLEGAKTSAEQEREAYAATDYEKLLDGLKVAVETEEKIRWEMVAAQLTVEVWRTQSANARRELAAVE